MAGLGCAIPPPPGRVMLLRQDVCWHKSIMSARRRWNSFRRSFRLGGVGFLEEEERLLETAEEREGRIAEVMEVTETAVEGGMANKKKVKRVGKEKALGGRFTGKTFLAKTMSRSDMERIQRTWELLLGRKDGRNN